MKDSFENDLIVSQTKDWVEKVVIGLNLCPFARVPFQKDLISYVVFTGEDKNGFLENFCEELLYLSKVPPSKLETTLFITPNLFSDFTHYLEALSILENVIFQFQLDGVIQLASFHPNYKFDGTTEESPENFTNRSPFPMFHLLREESIEKAVSSHPNPDAIPEKNIETLKNLGLENIKTLLNEIRK